MKRFNKQLLNTCTWMFIIVELVSFLTITFVRSINVDTIMLAISLFHRTFINIWNEKVKNKFIIALSKIFYCISLTDERFFFIGTFFQYEEGINLGVKFLLTCNYFIYYNFNFGEQQFFLILWRKNFLIMTTGRNTSNNLEPILITQN